MPSIENKLESLGLVLPEPVNLCSRRFVRSVTSRLPERRDRA